MKGIIATLVGFTASVVYGQVGEPARVNQHKVANRSSPAPEPGAEREPIPSLIEGLHSADEWRTVRRPRLLEVWTSILGKLGPNEQDRQWFGDIREAVIHETADRGSYTRIALDLPIEKDFLQQHLLLVPKGRGPFPAVICWTSTTPDYHAPEEWWGRWLAEHGYVVLTSWSFIRHYRGDSDYGTGAAEKLYGRFGHWLPMAKMVHDAQREVEYLRSRQEVDGARIGFMGFSLSAKAAVYIAAFAPEIAATVAIDPHIAINGGTNWFAPWYLDWLRPFPDIPTPQHTVLSVLKGSMAQSPARPGFEHDHHELMALAAPRPFLLIGGKADSEDNGGDSDDRQSWGYYNRAKDVYRLLGVADRLQFVLTSNGHKPNGPEVDAEWRAFLDRWLRPKPQPVAQAYLRYLDEGMARVQAGMAAHPDAGLKELETAPGWKHFPSAVLAAAVLATRNSDPQERERMLRNAVTIGDLLTREHQTGYYASRLDHHRDTYMWLEAYRLLQDRLGPARTAQWRQALMEELTPIAQDVARLQDYPIYQSPFIGTSPNHYCLWSSTVYLASKVFGRTDWEKLSAKVLHRFAAEEQSSDGYWGEHSAAGPTTGYDYLTSSGIGVYWEHSRDPAALEALRRSLTFHKYFTWPDGTPVETINDRNRYWAPPVWGHFGFSNFPDGRRYAEFLTSFYSAQPFSLESLGRLAQNALYWHEGTTAPIPQDEAAYVNQLHVPAGVRKSGPWTVCLSGIVSTQAASQFYLDRQGNLSIFHKDRGLIITGANSKGQPELATLSERFGDTANHLPLSSSLHIRDSGDMLALGFNTFFAELKLAPIRAESIAFDMAITARSRTAERQIALQLYLKPGQFLETAGGTPVLLGEGPLKLGPDQIGGWIRHNGWTLKVPPGMRLEWPVRPYNPYANAPETGVEHAVGVLTGKLEPKSQVLSFALEAN